MNRRALAILAHVIAASHLAFTLFLVFGGLACRTRRRLVPAHLATVATMLAIAVPRKDCPLTTWEDRCRRRAGLEPHGSFIEHYLIRPWRPQGITPGLRKLLVALWVLPNLWAYGQLIAAATTAPSPSTSDGCSGGTGATP